MPGVAMKEKTIRFPADVWAAVEISAKERGESAAEYVRIASAARAMYDTARRGDEVSEGFGASFTAARDLLRVYDLDEP